MNEVLLVGRLGQDAELKYFESGACKASFSVATNRYDYKKKEKVTDWHRVEVWGKTAEFVGEHFKKGSQVLVQGTLQKEEYTNKDGEQKTIYKVVANKAQFDGAFIFTSGTVKEVNEKTNENNSTMSIVKLKANDVTLSDKTGYRIEKDNRNAFVCDLAMVNGIPYGNIIKSDCERPPKEDDKPKEETKKVEEKPKTEEKQEEIDECPF